MEYSYQYIANFEKIDPIFRPPKFVLSYSWTILFNQDIQNKQQVHKIPNKDDNKFAKKIDIDSFYGYYYVDLFEGIKFNVEHI